jgi:hypothetical protein
LRALVRGCEGTSVTRLSHAPSLALVVASPTRNADLDKSGRESPRKEIPRKACRIAKNKIDP